MGRSSAPRVLCACEESQAVTERLRKMGIEAYSCDLQPTSGRHPEWHIQADALEIVKMDWDMIIAFPPCTHLAVSGARWFDEKRRDGYPDGHGIDMAEAIVEADGMGIDTRAWCQPFLAKFLGKPCTVEFEPKGFQHGDLKYLYVVEGLVDHRWGAKHDGKLPVIISVYGIDCDENYADVEKREPIFSGTAYEYIERFGKEQ